MSISGRFAFTPFPIPCCGLRLCSTVSGGSTSSRCGSCVAWALVTPVPHIFRLWICPRRQVGSPKFVSCPFMRMPRSKTPVVSLALAIAHLGLMPSRLCNSVGFHCLAAAYPFGPQSYMFRDSMSRPAHSLPLCFAHPLSGIALRFRYPPLWLYSDGTGFSPAEQHQQISMPISTSQCFTFHLARA